MIKNWHICISGFRQHEGELTGMYRLWLKLGSLRAPDTCVMLREWDADWEELADLIWLTSIEPVVNIYAYSWGAGYGFVTLAGALGKRGVAVHTAVLCDPVYRSRFLLLRWLALVWWPVIRIPSNVLRVWSYYQRVDRPRAHRLIARRDASTSIHRPKEIKIGHRWMDECEPFHRRGLSVAGVKQ